MRAMLWLCLPPLLASCAASSVDPISHNQPVLAQAGGGASAQARAKSHTDLGAAYYESRQFATALDEARVAIAADGSYAPAHNLLALIYVELKEHRAAGEAFEKALRLAPGDPEIGNNYGWFLCQVSQQQKGLQYLQMAASNPLYAAPTVALTNAAVCAQGLNDLDGAGEFLARALRYDANNSRALFLLAALNCQRGRYHEAQLNIADFHRRIEPTAESAWLALRIARKLGNRTDEARFGALLRQRFVDSSEYQKLTQGQYE